MSGLGLGLGLGLGFDMLLIVIYVVDTIINFAICYELANLVCKTKQNNTWLLS